MLDQTPRHVLHEHTDTIRDLAWSFDSTRLASLSIQHDKRIIVWDTYTWHPVQEWASGAGVTSIYFSPDGTTLYGTGTSPDIHVWNVATGALRRIPTAYRRAGIRFDATQQPFMIFCHDHHVGRCAVEDQNITSIEAPPSYAAIVDHCGWFNQDASLIAIEARDHSILVWDSARQIMIAHVVDTHDGVMDVAFHERHPWIGIVRENGIASLWDRTTAQKLYQYTSALPDVTDMLLNTEVPIMALVNADAAIELWDIHTPRVYARLDAHGGQLVAAFSPHGAFLASGGDDNQLRIWAV